MLAQKSACENVRRERRSMSKNELRSSGERRKRGIANGAGELPSPFHKCRAGGFPAVSGTASAHVHMLCLTFIIGIVAAFYRFAVDLRHPVRVSVCVSCAAFLLPVSYTHLDVYKRQALYQCCSLLTKDILSQL